MPTAKRGPVLEFFWRMHKWVLRVSGGRLFTRIGKLPVLLLFTRGRKSGEVRMNALSYVPHGNTYAVVASNAGAGFHPGWWLNLREMAETEIQIRGQGKMVQWREAKGNEKDKIFTEFVKAEPSYAEYKKGTKREFPVVILKPRA